MMQESVTSSNEKMVRMSKARCGPYGNLNGGL